jgi:hypothetical protein
MASGNPDSRRSGLGAGGRAALTKDDSAAGTSSRTSRFSLVSMYCGITDGLGCAVMSWRVYGGGLFGPAGHGVCGGGQPSSGDWPVGGDGTTTCVRGSRVVAADVRRARIDHGAHDRNCVGRSHRRWCPAGRCCCGSGNCGRRSVPGRLAGSAGVFGESAVPPRVHATLRPRSRPTNSGAEPKLRARISRTLNEVRESVARPLDVRCDPGRDLSGDG